MNAKRFLLALGLSFLCLVPAVVGEASIITNGSFEFGVKPPTGTYTTLFTGSTAITGWTVTGHSIDWINSYWTAANGSKSLDLAGNGDGGILWSTSLSTVAGMSYKLTFAIAGNPDRNPGLRALDVSVGNLPVSTFLFNTVGKTRANMGWEYKSLYFTAATSSTVLGFTNGKVNGVSTAPYGVALDDVEVVPVPEPFSLAVWSVLGLTAISLKRWAARRKG